MIKFLDNRFNFIQSIVDNDILSSPITSISFSQDSKFVAYASKNGFFKIYNLLINDFILNGKIPNDYVSTILFNKDNSKLAICTSTGDIYTYTAPTYQTSNFKLKLQTKINCMKFSPSLIDTVGVATEDGTVKIIDLIKGEILANFEGFHTGPATSISFSPVSKVFVSSCGKDGKINFYDIDKKVLVKTIQTNCSFTTITFTSRGDQVFCGDVEGYVHLYDIRNSNSPKAVLTGNKGRINYIEIGNKQILKSSISQSSGNTKNNMALSSGSMSNFEDQKKPELIKHDKNSSSQRIPLNERSMNIMSNTNNVFMNQTYQKSKGESSFPQLDSKLKPSSNIINDNNSMAVDEQYEIKKAMDKKTYSILNNSNSNVSPYKQLQEGIGDNLDPDVKKYIKTCIENETNQLKQFIHEEINTLHVDLIRQFEIQQAEMMNSIKEFSMMNTKMTQEIERLKKENENLKSKYF